jgi:hypothetical protein
MNLTSQSAPHHSTRNDSPVLALLVVGQLVLDHVDHDLVADEVSSVHDLLGLFTEVGLLLDLRSKHVTSSQVADAVFPRDVWGLCTLSYIVSFTRTATNTGNVPAPGGPMRTIRGAPAVAPRPTADLTSFMVEATTDPVLSSSWVILFCS